MMKRIAILLLCGLSLAAFYSPLPEGFTKGNNGGIVHKLSGFRFPEQMVGFVSGNELIVRYLNKNNDVSVGYNYYGSIVAVKPQKEITGTVYVYNMNDPSDKAPNIQQINNSVLQEISTVHGDSLRNLTKNPVKVQCGKKSLSGMYDRFEIKNFAIADPAKYFMGEVYLFAVNSWVVKFRFTNEVKNNAATEALVKQFFETNKNHSYCQS